MHILWWWIKRLSMSGLTQAKKHNEDSWSMSPCLEIMKHILSTFLHGSRWCLINAVVLGCLSCSYWLMVWLWWVMMEVKWMKRWKSWLLVDRTAEGVDAVLSSVHCCCVDILRGVEGWVHVRISSLTVVVAGEGLWYLRLCGENIFWSLGRCWSRERSGYWCCLKDSGLYWTQKVSVGSGRLSVYVISM